MTEQEAEQRLKELLTKRGVSRCRGCARELDRGDVAWNNSGTFAGTPFTYVYVQCEGCGREAATIFSWWPGTDGFAELVEQVLDDGSSEWRIPGKEAKR